MISSTSGTESRVDDERVVAGRLERVRAARRTRRAPSWRISEVLPCITCGARTTVAAVDLADALVAEAHAEHRDARPPKCADRRRSTRRRPRAARARARSSTASGSSASISSSVERVVAVHDRLGAELPEVLHEVVDERVVVVDHEHARAHDRHGTGPATAPAQG